MFHGESTGSPVGDRWGVTPGKGHMTELNLWHQTSEFLPVNHVTKKRKSWRIHHHILLLLPAFISVATLPRVNLCWVTLPVIGFRDNRRKMSLDDRKIWRLCCLFGVCVVFVRLSLLPLSFVRSINRTPLMCLFTARLVNICTLDLLSTPLWEEKDFILIEQT